VLYFSFYVYVAAVVKLPRVLCSPAFFERCVTSPCSVWRLPSALGPLVSNDLLSVRALNARHPMLSASFDDSREACRRQPHLYDGFCERPGRITGCLHQYQDPGVTQHCTTAYASLRTAPSGNTPLTRKRHSAMSNLRATATIPIRLRRFPPAPKRSRNQQLRAL
jgi:hypothetical protein